MSYTSFTPTRAEVGESSGRKWIQLIETQGSSLSIWEIHPDHVDGIVAAINAGLAAKISAKARPQAQESCTDDGA